MAASLRVVAGSAGGRRLSAPAGRRLRPTSERVREAVFASLGSLGAVEGATVLDLFAGTGAMGIEALSRGAARVTFVDDDPVAVGTISANLATTGFSPWATVVQGDAVRFLDGCRETFDVALADPPYAFDGWREVLARLRARLAVLESGSVIELGPGWEAVRTRRYGDTVVTLARPCSRG
ncbi:MAG: RsmD family RNA methyltransferase [Acidimicrobiia bacterium]